MEIQFRAQREISKQGGKIAQYCDLAVGKRSWISLLKYELIVLFCSHVPGALGYFLRSKFYPLLFKKCGRNVVFGSHITLRHPHKIEIGDSVMIDSQCLLDAKGETNKGIVIGNGVFIGRNTILSCKNGDIILEENVNIGANSYLFSGSSVILRKNTLVAAYCYFIGGDHELTDPDKSFLEQPQVSKGIETGENCWFGAGVKIQDGAKIGKGSVIGTGAVVTKNIPAYSVAVGLPARVVSDRKPK